MSSRLDIATAITSAVAADRWFANRAEWTKQHPRRECCNDFAAGFHRDLTDLREHRIAGSR